MSIGSVGAPAIPVPNLGSSLAMDIHRQELESSLNVLRLADEDGDAQTRAAMSGVVYNLSSKSGLPPDKAQQVQQIAANGNHESIIAAVKYIQAYNVRGSLLDSPPAGMSQPQDSGSYGGQAYGQQPSPAISQPAPPPPPVSQTPSGMYNATGAPAA